jgi:hypothetical protein
VFWPHGFISKSKLIFACSRYVILLFKEEQERTADRCETAANSCNDEKMFTIPSSPIYDIAQPSPPTSWATHYRSHFDNTFINNRLSSTDINNISVSSPSCSSSAILIAARG